MAAERTSCCQKKASSSPSWPSSRLQVSEWHRISLKSVSGGIVFAICQASPGEERRATQQGVEALRGEVALVRRKLEVSDVEPGLRDYLPHRRQRTKEVADNVEKNGRDFVAASLPFDRIVFHFSARSRRPMKP